jgi:hypothetical protein
MQLALVLAVLDNSNDTVWEIVGILAIIALVIWIVRR